METVIDALKELVPTKHVKMNVKAFRLGYEAMEKERADQL